MTTVDLESCAGRRRLRLDRQFDRTVTVLWSMLDTTGRAEFVRAQAARTVYADQECSASARAFLGGTAAPVLYGMCLADDTAARVRDVSGMVKVYCHGKVRSGLFRLCPRA